MDLEDNIQSMNSELRFLTLELMKLAEKRGITFDEIAKEYVGNVHLMQRMVDDTVRSPKIVKESGPTSD